MNILEFLKKFNVEITDEQKTAFEQEFATAYKSNDEFEKQNATIENYKNQLETAQKTLKTFEGVNVDEMNNKIKTLTADLESKQKEFDTKIADMEFNSVLDNALSKIGARNSKAVKSLLDIDTLKSSKNQAEDISKALEQVKIDNDYMFTSDEPIRNAVRETSNNISKSSSDSLLRSAMGLPSENK